MLVTYIEKAMCVNKTKAFGDRSDVVIQTKSSRTVACNTSLGAAS